MDADIIIRYPKVSLMCLNLTNLLEDQKWLKFDILVPTNLVVVFISKNRLVCILMSSMLSIFSFQASDKLDSEVLKFWLYKELPILEWISTWFFKHTRIPVHMYFQISIAL